MKWFKTLETPIPENIDIIARDNYGDIYHCYKKGLELRDSITGYGLLLNEKDIKEWIYK